ncbi:MAG: sigma 54-interacting transcriptional regulator [Polyangiaceae bacterium]
MFSNALPKDDRPSDTLPPPSGTREVAPASGSRKVEEARTAQEAREGDAALGYATIDLPPSDRVTGPVRVRIEGSSGPREVTSRVLRPGEELVLGAAPEADVTIADPTVSARHCALSHQGGVVHVLDLESRNGVRIAGSRVTRAACSPGGSFEIGRTMVHVEAITKDELAGDETELPGLIGSTQVMRRLAAAVRGVGPLRLPVLLRGESGTGKDVVARAIHSESSRARRPFVVLNAATIRPELAESELFGHERGAFTGAVRERRGAFREAHGGTLFLDEIAALPLAVQAKLLRAVEQCTVRPLGGEAEHRVDVRLVAATCEPLEQMVRERRFRGDLYERLAVCVLRIPSLRERLDDLHALSRHLLKTSEVGLRPLGSCAITALRRHTWPGNVRELRNVLVQAAIASHEGPILGRHIRDVLEAREEAGRRKLTPAEALRIFEEAGFNVSAAARMAELPRTTMRDLLELAGAPFGVKKARATRGGEVDVEVEPEAEAEAG